MNEGLLRPTTDEYSPFYAGYIARVPEGATSDGLFALLAGQPNALRELLAGIDDAEAGRRPAPAEWSIKEVLGHINDAERVFAYRALRIARADSTPLPGFDQDDYVANGDFAARPLSDLLDEFDWARRANLLAFRPLSAAAFARTGTASGGPISARALLYIMAGHVEHHLASFREVYLRV
jgi:hypothetical protein